MVAHYFHCFWWAAGALPPLVTFNIFIFIIIPINIITFVMISIIENYTTKETTMKHTSATSGGQLGQGTMLMETFNNHFPHH